MSDKIDESDLTDDAVLKMLIDRERKSIIYQRHLEAASREFERQVTYYIKKYGTDEG